MSKENDAFVSLRESIKAEVMEFDEHENCESRLTVLRVVDKSDDGFVELYDEDARSYTRFNVHALDAALGREIVEIRPDRTARLRVCSLCRGLPTLDERSGRSSSVHPNGEEQKKEALPVVAAVPDVPSLVRLMMVPSDARRIVDALDYLRYCHEGIEPDRSADIVRDANAPRCRNIADALNNELNKIEGRS